MSSSQSAQWDDRFEAILKEVLDPAIPLEPGTLLIEHLGIDSLQIVELLGELEKTYDFEFPNEALNPQTFETPASLWAFVANAKGGPE